MKYEKQHHKVHIPAPDDRDQRYCVTSTGGSNIHCFDTLDGAFEWIRSNENSRIRRAAEAKQTTGVST